MPRTIDETMMSNSARKRLCSASGRMVAGRRVPIPVRVTMPMMMPTDADAATSEMTSRDDLTNARMMSDTESRVRGLNAPTTTIASSDRLTARNGV